MSAIDNRLRQLESHLEQENPILLKSIRSFRQLDGIAYRMGLLSEESSFATQIPWWPLISVLGTFSAGKSTFINHFLGTPLQRSGNQAVDDKFTVICYSQEQTPHALPGIALDADPRFPFYQMSNEIEQVAAGEGARIDAYLQLKTCPSENLRGKIIIDSPGFDADAQRTSTLRITDHIINLSDLVLVFFDARHPEPGAMRDTLDHLISSTIHRPDSSKFLYILNQIDTTARENNPEDIIAAWQRSLGERGLTAGRFYSIYSPDAAVVIEDEALKARYEMKRDEDLGEIHSRMQQVEIERAYRIVGALEKTVQEIEEHAVPKLRTHLKEWRKWVLIGDAVIFTMFFVAALTLTINAGYWNGLSFAPPWLADESTAEMGKWGSLIITMIILSGIHFAVRSVTRRWKSRKLGQQSPRSALRIDLPAAFNRSTRPIRSIFFTNPAGWGRRTKKLLANVIQDTETYVQALNDGFTNPSGRKAPAKAKGRKRRS
ncbi:MAG: dynamin family protein [Candidatus Polarisedimenticolaceae bacterium]|nr:dynamin family protein [Candidatus Polarisedimenticolaceae bacterium]